MRPRECPDCGLVIPEDARSGVEVCECPKGDRTTYTESGNLLYPRDEWYRNRSDNDVE